MSACLCSSPAWNLIVERSEVYVHYLFRERPPEAYRRFALTGQMEARIGR